ncbi:MAG: alpha/beta hydrolase [Bryobacterales bacterium]|nr:alpha/beta hydrolase [Bryobacterales bacterium]MBV9399938.1 alpha/beta hydrolase [Bryobacterales bacterium]
MTRRELFENSALAAGAAALIAQQAKAADLPESGWKKFFPATFRNERIKTSGAEINAVIGGSGPPLLMLHGAPQSLITWRLIAADLAKDHTLVLCDLRGYGDSSKPADQPDHSSQSKRPMALDGVEVMEHLGYRQFNLVGHDRGGRVGRRMALDHPDRVQKLVVMDIVPAHYLYSHVTIEFVQAYFHWFNYLRPAPGPENDLKAQNDAALERARDDAQREYLRAMTNPLTIHAMCEDYRASASVDLKIDEADIKAGKKIKCPLLTLWAATGAMGKLYDVLGIWKQEGVNVSGKGLPGNHSLQESAPKETLAEIQSFLKA